MNPILDKKLLAKDIWEMSVEAPWVAKKGQPGQFVLVMGSQTAERIPLTIADFDRQRGTVTLVFMAVGVSTRKLAAMNAGESLFALLGPLGAASEIHPFGTVVLVAGGVGSAPVFPIARAFKEAGQQVVVIQGARTRELLFWTERLASASTRHIVCTDDGTFGRAGRVSEPLKELLEADQETKRIGCVYAIGPEIMMRVCSDVTRPYGVKTLVSLNTIMVDGTGMCGGCRVNVGKKTFFTCVDGPEFDGHQVDWGLLLSRQKVYVHDERCALDRYTHEQTGVKV